MSNVTVCLHDNVSDYYVVRLFQLLRLNVYLFVSFCVCGLFFLLFLNTGFIIIEGGRSPHICYFRHLTRTTDSP